MERWTSSLPAIIMGMKAGENILHWLLSRRCRSGYTYMDSSGEKGNQHQNILTEQNQCFLPFSTMSVEKLTKVLLFRISGFPTVISSQRKPHTFEIGIPFYHSGMMGEDDDEDGQEGDER